MDLIVGDRQRDSKGIIVRSDDILIVLVGKTDKGARLGPWQVSL